MKAKLDFVCGFRGAGKTTFISGLLRELPESLNVSVLIGENGDFQLPDTSACSALKEETALFRNGICIRYLTGGCLCCTASRLLTDALIAISRDEHPDRVIIEANSQARLSDLVSLPENPALSGLYAPGLKISVLDTSCFERRMLISGAFSEDQFRESDIVLLTRTSCRTDSAYHKIVRQIRDAGCCGQIEKAESMGAAEVIRMMQGERLLPKAENIRIRIPGFRTGRRPPVLSVSFPPDPGNGAA